MEKWDSRKSQSTVILPGRKPRIEAPRFLVIGYGIKLHSVLVATESERGTNLILDPTKRAQRLSGIVVCNPRAGRNTPCIVVVGLETP